VKTPTETCENVIWYGPRMEIARGIAILLVTLGHSEPIKTALPSMKEFIYSFHMPLFFFMSGFFSVRFISEGLVSYVLPRIKRLLIPYITISFSFFIIKFVVPSMVNRPVDPARFLLDIFVYPLNNPALFLWFLYVIILMKLFTAFLRFIPVWLMFILAALPALTGMADYDFAAFSHLGKYMIFFTAGLWVANYKKSFFAFITGHRKALLWTCSFLFFYMLNVTMTLKLPSLDVLVAFAGTFMVISMCFTWHDTLKFSFLKFAGRYSLEIYLLQYYFIFPVYYLMLKQDIDPICIIPFTFAAGIAGPIIIIKYFLPRCRWAALCLGSKI